MVDLVSPRLLGNVEHRTPEVAAVPDPRPAAPGYGLVRVCFGFRLDGATRRSRFVAAYLRAALDDPGITAAELWAETIPATGGTAAVSTLSTGAISWLVGQPEGDRPIPAECLAHAVLQVPLGAEVLSGVLRVDVSTTAPTGVPLGGPRREHASSAAGHRFAVPLPPGWDDVARPVAVAPEQGRRRPGRPAVRLCYAADIERFRRFSGTAAERAQTRFFAVLAEARRRAGVDDRSVELQGSGDGQFAVLAPGVDESVVVPAFVEGLRSALRELNADLNDHARLRLRVALHRGHLVPSDGGASGDVPIAIHRLLDSHELRAALAGAQDAQFALIVPDVLYREIVRPRYGSLDPAEFSPVQATVPAKEFSDHAWIHLAR
ncbi:hypothetical protein V5P93_007109 [Actinokineospora auranticolor]|uniref:Guanylate cyclase domain-containing protein n=1 Tax=Actinokineospora auranticolor TaxID=155976 RepID=A0A2S6GGU4_9PSEU|nr:hypothetical protein [Actinokineospora auranticolor]PPK64442.1 hypothetical protein CLV40_1195 [Actinokineospora auranticolor]